ncbi:MAG: hypothetical protein Q9227_001669 [Pyrenula ochraceoflavens]
MSSREDGTGTMDTSMIFAYLQPANLSAKFAFSEVIEHSRAKPGWTPHIGNFLEYEPYVGSRSSSRSSDDEDEAQNSLAVQWQGRFVLRFDTQPRNPYAGWILGGKSIFDSSEEGPDLLVTTQKGADGVRSRHCRLHFNFASSVLLLTAEKARQITVFSNGTQDIEGASTAISNTSTSFQVGNLLFTLLWSDMPRSVYDTQVASLRLENPSITVVPSQILDPTPRDNDYRIPGFILKEIIATGSTSAVYTGITQDFGNPVAVKRMTRKPHNVALISHEIHVLKTLNRQREHVRFHEVADPDDLSDNV